MVKFKGSCDSRDLEKDAQFYYEKLVQWLNDNAVNDDECVEAIEVLDNLVELVGLDLRVRVLIALTYFILRMV